MIPVDPVASAAPTAVPTAVGLAGPLTAGLLEVVEPGEDRPVHALELVEPGMVLAAGDLAVGLGARDVAEALALAEQARGAAGLLLRRPLAQAAEVRAVAVDARLPLLALVDDAGWTAAVGLLRTALDRASTGPGAGRTDDVYGDLFDMADTISAVVEAPVTIEDATSRVLAYSTGQHDVDEARTSTIVGRQVPRPVRDHFRALGVFRRLARSDDPFFVPAGQDDVKPRYVVPVRAGGEWLGSVWAVVDGPVPVDREDELRAAARVIALHLLRLRAATELHRQVQLDRVRTLLRGSAAGDPGPGPWRAVVLAGPAGDLDAAARCELWTALARRHGWRHPLVADLEGEVLAVVAAGPPEARAAPGGWSWLTQVVEREARTDPALGASAGGVATTVAGLATSRAQAVELAGLPGARDGARSVASAEDHWTALVLARAVRGLRADPSLASLTPLRDLLDADAGRSRGALLDTLEAVLDHWGEPQRAARALGVHANTVRYRMGQLSAACALDLTDPEQRLAARLLVAQARGRA